MSTGDPNCKQAQPSIIHTSWYSSMHQKYKSFDVFDGDASIVFHEAAGDGRYSTKFSMTFGAIDLARWSMQLF